MSNKGKIIEIIGPVVDVQFDSSAMPAIYQALQVEFIESSCCGMAGSFGIEAEHYAVSMRMGELSLLPKVRAAEAGTLLVANGTSCRHQIHDGTGRRAVHVARVLARALEETVSGRG